MHFCDLDPKCYCNMDFDPNPSVKQCAESGHKRDCRMRFLSSVFSWTDSLRPNFTQENILDFCHDFLEIFKNFKSLSSAYHIPETGKCSLSGVWCRESALFPCIIRQKVFTFQSMVRGKWLARNLSTKMWPYSPIQGCLRHFSTMFGNHFPRTITRKVF